MELQVRGRTNEEAMYYEQIYVVNAFTREPLLLVFVI